MSSFEFNGITKDYISVARDWTLPAFAPIEREYTEVPGRAGAIQTEMRTGVRRFQLPIIIHSKTFEEKQLFAEDLAEWLIHKNPKPLVFEKYPNRVLFAAIEGTLDLPQMLKRGKGVLQIVCEDPYAYSRKEEKFAFKDGAAIIRNKGKISVKPTIALNVLRDISHLDLFTDLAYMRVGQPANLGESAVVKLERVLWEQMNSLIGWSENGTSVDGGIVAGAFASNGYEFYAGSYGDGPKWHGPSGKASIPNAPLRNFRVEVRLRFPSPRGVYGRAETYLLDDQSNVIAKIAMKQTGATKGNAVEVRLGGAEDYKYILNYAGSKGIEWDNFDGVLSLEREGNVWTAYVAQIDPDTGRHTSRLSQSMGRYVDTEQRFVGNLSQIQLHIAKHSDLPHPFIRFLDLKIFRINEVPKEDPRIIAREGDQIEVNFKAGKIYLNGKERPDLKGDFGAQFFELPKGVTPILLDPADAFEATAAIREGYR